MIAPGFSHGRYGRPGAQEYPFGIDVHDPVPLLRSGIFQDAPRHHSGVVYQDIQLAVPSDRSSCGRFPVRFRYYIQVHVGGLTTQFPDLGFYFSSFFIQNVSKNHPGALSGKKPDLSSTLTSSAAANQRDLIIQPHGSSPLEAVPCSYSL